MTVSQNKRRIIPNITATDLEGMRQQLNSIFRQLMGYVSQMDAVGQRPDFKGQDVLNLGNLKNIDSLDTGAALADVIAKVNEVLAAFNDLGG